MATLKETNRAAVEGEAQFNDADSSEVQASMAGLAARIQSELLGR